MSLHRRLSTMHHRHFLVALLMLTSALFAPLGCGTGAAVPQNDDPLTGEFQGQILSAKDPFLKSELDLHFLNPVGTHLTGTASVVVNARTYNNVGLDGSVTQTHSFAATVRIPQNIGLYTISGQLSGDTLSVDYRLTSLDGNTTIDIGHGVLDRVLPPPPSDNSGD